MIGERVFLRHIVFEDGLEPRPFRREFRKFKPAPFLEAAEEDALAVLWHDAPRINDLVTKPYSRGEIGFVFFVLFRG